jgi:hypothetical protein
MDDIRIQGMTHNFIYDEFHPDDAADSLMCAEDFLRALFRKEDRVLSAILSEEEWYDSRGTLLSPDERWSRIAAFWDANQTLLCSRARGTGARVNGNYAEAEIDTAWSGTSPDTGGVDGRSGIARVRLKRSPYGGWDVVQARIPGLTL